jgi:hypothetical protein
MTRQKTQIDNLIQPALQEVLKRSKGSYFRKSEVVAEVASYPRLQSVLQELRRRFGGWNIDEIVLRYAESKVGDTLQQKDAHGIRVYECYAAGSPERRWMPFQAMTATTLLAVMQETRTQARQLTLKGAGYELFYDELVKLDATATVADVYDRVAPEVMKHRTE